MLIAVVALLSVGCSVLIRLAADDLYAAYDQARGLTLKQPHQVGDAAVCAALSRPAMGDRVARHRRAGGGSALRRSDARRSRGCRVAGLLVAVLTGRSSSSTRRRVEANAPGRHNGQYRHHLVGGGDRRCPARRARDSGRNGSSAAHIRKSSSRSPGARAHSADHG